MEYRLLGRSGVRVSAIGLGGNQFGSKVDAAGTARIVHHALDQGVNFIDTADVYSQRGRSEEVLGQALQGRWDRVILATKYRSAMGEGPNDKGASRYHMLRAVEGSLRRLQTDHIDLLQVHSWDGDTPIDEMMRGLDDLIASGKVGYIGCSNFLAWQMCRANDVAERYGWAPFITVQPHYHMLERGIERELVPYCQMFHIGILPYFPLAGGFLTGKYKEGEAPPPGTRGESSAYVQRYFKPENFAKVRTLTEWAEARGHTMAELAIAWLLGQPQIPSVIAGVTTPATVDRGVTLKRHVVSSVICGVTSVEQVDANVKAADWHLTDDELGEVTKILDESVRQG